MIGLGHLGKFHARVYAKLPEVELRYLVDSDLPRAQAVASECGGQAQADYRGILREVDAVSVVTPTGTHHAIARDFLGAGVSVLVEKPMASTVEEADDLIRAAAAAGVRLQVGHIERFNPAYVAVRDSIKEPAFIEGHRLSPYSFRSTEVSVVLDLMIHDLDLTLDIAGAAAVSQEAAGVPILSGTPDIANARLRFGGAGGAKGCIANLTASRVSLKPMRRLRVFQRDEYISMDFLEKKAYVFRKKEGFDALRADSGILAAAAKLPKEHALGQLVDIRPMTVGPADALESELSSFVQAVRTGATPLVTGEHGRRALALAVAIDEDIRRFIAERRG